MILRTLRATDFRGYAELNVELDGRLTVLAGDNAQGKTNFLRAVETLGMGDSAALAAGEAVRFGAEKAAVEGKVEKGGSSYDERLRVDLSTASRDGEQGSRAIRSGSLGKSVSGFGAGGEHGSPNAKSVSGFGAGVRLSLNGKTVPRSRWIGRLPVLFVGPEDRDQVTGPPSARRALLDELLEQCEPEYLTALREYRRALRQRNRALSRAESSEEEIEIWEEPLARAGSILLAHRLKAVSALGPRATEWHRELVGGGGGGGLGDGLAVEYVSEFPLAAAGASASAIAKALAEALASARGHERLFGSTLVGPHRDEVSISFAGRLLKGAGSSGEIWSAILSLAFASAEHLGRKLGSLPVLLLDDVLTALDATRRERLLSVLMGFPQALLTTTHRPQALKEGSIRIFTVSGHHLELVAGKSPARAGKMPADPNAGGKTEWEPDQGLLAPC